MAGRGGVKRQRAREKLIKRGPLRSLLDRPLAAIDGVAVVRPQWVSKPPGMRRRLTLHLVQQPGAAQVDRVSFTGQFWYET